MKVFILIVLCASYAPLSSAQIFGGQATSRCLNPNQRPGSCVSIYDCQTLLSVLQREPLQKFDQDFVRASQCNGPHGSAPHVCCSSDTGYTRRERVWDSSSSNGNWWRNPPAAQPQPERPLVLRPVYDQSLIGTPLEEVGDFGMQPMFDSSYIATPLEEVGDFGTQRPSSLPQSPYCGGVTIGNKIQGGVDADLFEFPWMVLFEYRTKSGSTSVSCAGSLINNRYVVTAAHCVTGAILRDVGQLVSVRLGEHDTSKSIDCAGTNCAPKTVRVGVDEIIPHKEYTDGSSNKQHDIALVRLSRNVRLTPNIGAICMPWTVKEEQRSGAEVKFTVAGWGSTLRSTASAIKQKLKVTLVDQKQCQQRFRQLRVDVKDTQLCAGGKFREDSCDGDSGGPLMRLREGVWVLEGVVSFGYKCGLKNWPAVYTRVSKYEEWIRTNIHD